MEKPDRLWLLREQTLWFINEDPTTIVLTPRSGPTKGPGGGVLYGNAADRPAQTVKLIHQGGNGVSNGEGGEDRKYSYVIVLAHDSEIDLGDEFTIDNNRFVVFSMDPFNGYEKKAYARQHGKTPTDG